MDLFSTLAQLPAVEQLPQENNFFYDMFVTNGGTVEDDEAIYDVRKGIRRIAPVVHPGVGGVLMDRDGFDVRRIGFARVAPERIVTNQDIVTRAFGEKVFGAKTPAQRAKEMYVKDLMDMHKAIHNRRVHMARQVAMNGMLQMFEYTNEGRSLKTTKYADYGFTNKYTPTDRWNTAGAKIEYDMEKMVDIVCEGLGQVDVIIVSPDVKDAMLNNSGYMKQFDMRNVDMGEIRQKYKGQGIRFIGFNADGVEMYSCAGKFIDDDGAEKPMIPAGTLIAGQRGILTCYHGPVTQVEKADGEHVTYIKEEVPLRYSSVESNAVKNRITSCPTIVPKNVDGWIVAKVL